MLLTAVSRGEEVLRTGRSTFINRTIFIVEAGKPSATRRFPPPISIRAKISTNRSICSSGVSICTFVLVKQVTSKSKMIKMSTNTSIWCQYLSQHFYFTTSTGVSTVGLTVLLG